MDITPVIPRGKQVITGYGNGQFKIGGQVYSTPVLVFPDRTVMWDIKPNVRPYHRMPGGGDRRGGRDRSYC